MAANGNSSGRNFRDFRSLAESVQRKQPIIWPVLAVDPGDTTGYCVFDNCQLTEAGQLGTKGALVEPIRDLIERVQPSVVVAEEYRIYPDKALEHTHSVVPTIKLIGALEYVCRQRGIPIYFQAAATAKGFGTDDKLEMWGFWQRGQQHARDAIRHAIHYILFGSTKAKR